VALERIVVACPRCREKAEHLIAALESAGGCTCPKCGEPIRIDGDELARRVHAARQLADTRR